MEFERRVSSCPYSGAKEAHRACAIVCAEDWEGPFWGLDADGADGGSVVWELRDRIGVCKVEEEVEKEEQFHRWALVGNEHWEIRWEINTIIESSSRSNNG